MKPTKISYGRTIPLGSFNSERLEVEVEIEKDETPEQAFAYAKQIIEKTHRENNPHLYRQIHQVSSIGNGLGENNFKGINLDNQPTFKKEEPTFAPSVTTIPLSKEQIAEQLLKEQIANTISQIQQITDGTVLKTFEKLAMKHHETLSAYNLRAMEVEDKK